MKVAIIILVFIIIGGMIMFITNPEAVCETQANCTIESKS